MRASASRGRYMVIKLAVTEKMKIIHYLYYYHHHQHPFLVSLFNLCKIIFTLTGFY